MSTGNSNILPDDPLWFKDAIIYQLHVKTFFDSNDDGYGDFSGLIEKLDYVQDLGVNCIWILPFYPSPLRDDGYDIADYSKINPIYGDMSDFKRFVEESHKRGIRIMTELVVNHTSDQHPWFQRARSAPAGSVERDFYVWSDTDSKFPEVRIIFTDTETSNWSWDPVAKQYYWHRFFHHQPDLNFDNPAVIEEILGVMRFWMDMGVDGVRLDAIPYLVVREGTNGENLPETHAVIKKFRQALDERYSNRVFLAEANQWPADVIEYFGDGDECHMAYHFPLMPRIFMAVHQEDRHPIVEIMRQTPSIPDNCQWAIFLRNHDELTLEMVTDEERDYMYRAYASDPIMRCNVGIRRRLAPLLEQSRPKIELLNSLLLSMPGTPILYYGDEIGMGDNVYLGDRNGVRTPMQWSSDRNAGFSRAPFSKLYSPPIMDPVTGYQSVNVEAQLLDSSSLLYWMRNIIRVRNQYKVFGRGDITFLEPENRRVLVYLRSYEEERVLCVANLSRFPQSVSIDLSEYAGVEPLEIFGLGRFHKIDESPYILTLAPHAYYWLSLTPALPDTAYSAITETSICHFGADQSSLPVCVMETPLDWKEALFESTFLEELECKLLPDYIRRTSWLGEISLAIAKVAIRNVFQLDSTEGELPAFIVVFRLIASNNVNEPTPDEGELYWIGLALMSDSSITENTGADGGAKSFSDSEPESVIARIDSGNASTCLVNGFDNERFRLSLLRLLSERATIRAGNALLVAESTDDLSRYVVSDDANNDAQRADTHDDILQKTASAETESILSGATILGLKTDSSEPRILDEIVTAKSVGLHNNTLLTYGDSLYLKAFRRIDNENMHEWNIGNFLTENAKFPFTPPLLGRIFLKDDDGKVHLLCLLSKSIANQGNGWDYSLEELRRVFERASVNPALLPIIQEYTNPIGPLGKALSSVPELIPEDLYTVLGIYVKQAASLGARTAELHMALASAEVEPLLPENFESKEIKDIASALRSAVNKTIEALQLRVDNSSDELVALVRALAERRPQIMKIIDDFSRLDPEVEKLRKIAVHGNYHLGQVLYTDDDFWVLDFGGEPLDAGKERLTKASPLRDVAGMLRSFDYALIASLYIHTRQSDSELEKFMPWARICHRWIAGMFLREYLGVAEKAGFIPHDPEVLNSMLKFYILEKGLYELRFEQERRPDWLKISLKSVIAQIDEFDSQ